MPDEDGGTTIPDFCRIPQAERNAEWVKHPPGSSALRKLPALPPPPATKED